MQPDFMFITILYTMSFNISSLVTRLNSVVDEIDVYENSSEYVSDAEIINYVKYLEAIQKNLKEYADTFGNGEIPQKIALALETATIALEKQNIKYNDLRERILEQGGGNKRVKVLNTDYLGDGQNLSTRVGNYLNTNSPEMIQSQVSGRFPLIDRQRSSNNALLERSQRLYAMSTKPIFLKSLLLQYVTQVPDVNNDAFNSSLQAYINSIPYAVPNANQSISALIQQLLMIIEETHEVPHNVLLREFSLADPTKRIRTPVYTPLRLLSSPIYTEVQGLTSVLQGTDGPRSILEGILRQNYERINEVQVEDADV